MLGAPAVQGGTLNWPQDGSDRTTVDLPYTNTTHEPVELRLSVSGVTGNDGSAVRSPIARLGARSAPGALTSVQLSYSYDGGETWTQADRPSGTVSGPCP